MSKPFGNPLWDQLQKIRVTREGGVQAPVEADGEDGIVVGDPPLGVPPRTERKPGAVHRLLARLRG